MIFKTAWQNSLKTAVIILTVTLVTGALLFTGIKLASASIPAYNIITEYPANPVFDPVERAYYPSIIFDGATYHLWYGDGTGTRYTTSLDGITWGVGTSVTGLTNGLHAVVVDTGTKYLIWYWDSSQLYSINAIRTAESTDGINWTSDAAITQVGMTIITGTWPDWNTGSYGPCEVFYNAGGSATIVAPVDAATVWQNKFVMYYDGTTGAVEDIGLAVSADGKVWQGYNGGAAPVLAHAGGTAWDSDFATFGSVQQIGGLYHMWYSGGQVASSEGIGYAQSPDGITWTKDVGNPILHFTDGVPWRSARTYTPRVLYNAGGSGIVQMWYSGVAVGNYAIGYAAVTALTPTPTPGLTVGGDVGRVNKFTLLAPYFGLVMAILLVLFFTRWLVRKHGFIRVKG